MADMWKLANPVIWKEQVALVVGAASSRDHYYFAAKSRSHRDFFMVTWAFRISALANKKSAFE
jgi:hypothetical protein